MQRTPLRPLSGTHITWPCILRERLEEITSRIEAPSPRSNLAKPSHVMQQLYSEYVPKCMCDARGACKGNLQIRSFSWGRLAARRSGFLGSSPLTAHCVHFVYDTR